MPGAESIVLGLFAQVSQSESSGGTNLRETVDSLARTPISQIVILAVVLTAIRVITWPYLKNTLPHHRTGLYKIVRFVGELLDAVIYAGVFVFLIIRPFAVQAFVIPSGSMWPTLYVNDYIVANKAVYRYSNPKAGDVVVFRPPKTAFIPGRAGQLDESGEMKVDFVKRCVGVPGDLIEIRKGVLYRNGEVFHPEWKHLSDCTDVHIEESDNCQHYRELSDDEKAKLTAASFKLVMRDGHVIPLNYTDTDANSLGPSRGFGESPPYSIAQDFAISDQAEADRLKAAPAVKVPDGFYLMMGDNRNNSYDGRGWGLVPREQIVGRAEFIWFPLPRASKVH